MVFLIFVKFISFYSRNKACIKEILHIFVSFSKKLLPCLRQADFLLSYLSPNIIFNPKRSWSFVKGLVI
jgi:hypothetical protein